MSTLEKDERSLSDEGVVWYHLKYNNQELSNLYKRIGREKVEILLNPRDIRYIWVVDPSTSKPIKVGLGSGWAQSIAKIHGTNPIHASAWRTDLKSMKKKFKTKISPYYYQREMSKIKREELINKAKTDTKTVRKEREKIREVRKKSITSKIKSPVIEEVVIMDKETKKSNSSKKKKLDIDWDNLPTFPVDDFPSEQ